MVEQFILYHIALLISANSVERILRCYYRDVEFSFLLNVKRKCVGFIADKNNRSGNWKRPLGLIHHKWALPIELLPFFSRTARFICLRLLQKYVQSQSRSYIHTSGFQHSALLFPVNLHVPPCKIELFETSSSHVTLPHCFFFSSSSSNTHSFSFYLWR